MKKTTLEQELLNRLLKPLTITPARHPVTYFPTSARVVIFDIYGTLLSSAAGDVGPDSAAGSGSMVAWALVDAGVLERDSQAEYAQRFAHGIIEAAVWAARKELTRSGVDYPEVDILNIWETVLKEQGFSSLDEQTLRLAALSYECRINQVWPMNGMKEILEYLVRQNKLLGILSNAQFYTPVILETILQKSLPESGFCPELTVWSFEEGVGKPATHFYATMNRQLEKLGIPPQEVLFVGNDMLKDVVAGKKAGWQTVLFAGDVRSLRLHEGNPEVLGQQPDMVINALAQLKNILQ